ncbi:hypothetical protein D9M71_783750 [compost metagenome]
MLTAEHFPRLLKHQAVEGCGDVRQRLGHADHAVGEKGMDQRLPVHVVGIAVVLTQGGGLQEGLGKSFSGRIHCH